MGQLALLSDYSHWRGKTAKQIRDLVKLLGGWTAVFPGRLPKWAHRLRNAFNEPPHRLWRVTHEEAKREITKAIKVTASDMAKFRRAVARTEERDS